MDFSITGSLISIVGGLKDIFKIIGVKNIHCWQNYNPAIRFNHKDPRNLRSIKSRFLFKLSSLITLHTNSPLLLTKDL